MSSTTPSDTPAAPSASDPEAPTLEIPLSSASTIPSTNEPAVQPGVDTADLHNLDGGDPGPGPPNATVSMPTRPMLRRDKSVPITQQKQFPPAPAPPGGVGGQQQQQQFAGGVERGGSYGPYGVQSGAGSIRGGQVNMEPSSMGPGSMGAQNTGPNNPEDSLSLMQLRKLVTEMPRIEPTPYAFEYADAQGLPEELEEWFGYGVEETAMLLKAQGSFGEVWAAWDAGEGDEEWVEVEEGKRREFVDSLVKRIGSQTDPAERLRGLEALAYLALGVWGETAGLEDPTDQSPSPDKVKSLRDESTDTEATYSKSAVQIGWVKRNVQMIYDCNGIQAIYDFMRAALTRAW